MTAHFPGLGKGTSMKSGGVKQDFLGSGLPHSEVMRSCKCFPIVSKTLTTVRTALS